MMNIRIGLAVGQFLEVGPRVLLVTMPKSFSMLKDTGFASQFSSISMPSAL